MNTNALVGFGLISSALLSLSVNAAPSKLNARPTLKSVNNLIVNEDSGRQTIPLTGISAGGSDVGQTLTIEAYSSNPGLIPNPSVIYTSPDATGELEFTPVADQFGKATITVVVRDDGGTAGGAVNAVTNNIRVTVQSVNDAPSFEFASNYLALDDIQKTYVIPNIVQNVNFGPANESSQMARYVAIGADPYFFTYPPTISAQGDLTLVVRGDAAGETVVLFELRDSGGTVRGGSATSVPQFLQITIPNNPFYQMGGVYSGLFYEADVVRQESSGFFTFNVGTRSTYSGTLILGQEKLSFTGKFDLSGQSSTTIARSGGTPLTLSLQVDVTDGSDQVSGTLSNGEWTADVLGDRAVYDKNNQAPQVGPHTAAFLDLSCNPMAQAGNGYALLQVSKLGVAKITGALPGGTQMQISTSVSKNGEIPFYLFSATCQESLLGWIKLASTPNGQMEGTVVRIKPASGSGHFAMGLTNALDVIGSAYSRDDLLADSGTAMLANGELENPLANNILLHNNRIEVIGNETTGLGLSVNTGSGLVTGTFIHPVTGLPTTVKGALLQQQGWVAGYFDGLDSCGTFNILFDSKNDPRQR